MLSVRSRALLPLLRQRVRPSTRLPSFQCLLAPLHPTTTFSSSTRSFPQENDTNAALLHRLQDTLSDATTAAKVMAQEARGADLTDYEATTLLSNFSKQKRIDDCVGLLHYCREQKLKPEISARTAAFRTLCDAKEFAPALQLLTELTRDGVQLKPWIMGRALEAAAKMEKPELVAGFCQRLADKKNVKFSGVHDLVKMLGDRLDELALRSIAIFADRVGDAELALDVLQLMKREMHVTPDVYASVLEACGKSGRWTELVTVFEEMPENLREKLYSRPLSLVVRAHTRSENEDKTLRGLEIFYKHRKGKWSFFPCDAALEALLHTQQFDKVFDLADAMKQNGVEWSSFTYKMMTLAYIKSGLASNAKQMLLASVMRMENGGVECYRELISYFWEECGDRLEACQVYADLMQNSTHLDILDWTNALELSLELPDRSMYWHFRKQLHMCSKSTEVLIPSRLLLPIQEEVYTQFAQLPDDDSDRIQLSVPTNEGTEELQQLKSSNDVRGSSNVKTKELSALLLRFAKSKRVEECEELLRYCQEQDVTLDSTSRSSTFRCLCDAGRFEAALTLFKSLSTDKIALHPWIYGRALEAAVKLHREDIVLLVFRRLLKDANAFKDFQVETSGKGVHEMMCDARDRGVKLSKLILRSLVIFADRSNEAELAHDILAIMQSEGMEVSLDVYGSVLNAYGSSERWRDVLKLYDSMPENLQSQLHGTSLGWVITATSRTENEKLRDFSNTEAKHPRSDRSALLSDISLVRERFEDIKKNGGVGLTEYTASTFLGTMAKHKRVYDCVEILRYAETHNVPVKPFAALAAFSLFCEAKEFSQALHVFESLYTYEGSCTLKPWVFGWAMDAATNLNQQDLVVNIFQRLLAVQGGNFQLQPSEHGVYGMLFDAHDQGVKLSAFAFEALLSFADKSSQSDLALDVFTMMHDEGVELSSASYEMVLVACGKNEQWSDAVQVYQDMPKMRRSELTSAALGSVVMAHTQSEDEELIANGLELFHDHKSKWSTFACNAALEALLQTQQFDGLFTLATDMKQQKVKWSSFTYKLVTLGHIRCGSIDKARQILQDNAKRMHNDSAACYEELIELYACTLGDTREAVQLCEDMMQNNWQLSFSNWHTALELSLALPDRTPYWRIRKHLWLRGESFEQTIPPHLLLSERESPRSQGLSFLSEGNLQVVHDTPTVPANISLALEVFNDVWNADGAGLTANVATKLLVTMAQYQRIGDCIEMVEFFEKHKVTPKPFARVAAFKALCYANEDDRAVELLESMLQDNVVLHDYPFAVNAAMKMNRQELVTKIIDHMRIQHKSLRRKDYDRICRRYGHVEEWGSTVSVLSSLGNENRQEPQHHL